MTYNIEQLRKKVVPYIKRYGYNGLVEKALQEFINSIEAEDTQAYAIAGSKQESAYDYPLEYSDDDYQVYVIPGPKPELTVNLDENYGC